MKFRRPSASWLLVLCLVGPAGGVRAEIVELEMVGAIPLDAKTRKHSIPRDKAIDEALWQGVSRIANDLLAESLPPVISLFPDAELADESDDDLVLDSSLDSDRDSETGMEVEADDGLIVAPPPEDPQIRIRRALGKDMVPFTRSFRIIEDQGERPVLFTDHPDAATEYVVVVAVEVDVSRLRERLISVGLLEPEGIEVLTGIMLEVRGLTQYRGYQEFLRVINANEVGAVSVVPLEYERGRVRLQVQAEWDADELLERLLASTSPELKITPLAVDDGKSPVGEAFWNRQGKSSLVLAVQWTPILPPSPEESEFGEPLAPPRESRRPQRSLRSGTPAAVASPPSGSPR